MMTKEGMLALCSRHLCFFVVDPNHSAHQSKTLITLYASPPQVVDGARLRWFFAGDT
jgi:hypothetical protein